MGVTQPVPRHVVITGAGSGIGAALARHYAKGGTRLSLMGRNAARLDLIAMECRDRGAKVTIHAGDVTSSEEMAAWLGSCDDDLGVDLVIANAGIGGDLVLAGPSGESLARAGLILDTNIKGVVNSISPLLPRMVARRHGAIVIIGSLAGLIALAESPVYCASKAAVRLYGLSLHRLLKPKGITVSVASPGFVDTPMSASLQRPLPFLWTAERAARHIAAGTAKGKREIIFPWQLALAARLARLLPQSWVDRILAGVGA